MMEMPSTAGPEVPGRATRTDADVRAVLSALRDLSSPAEVEAESALLPSTDRYTRVRLHARGGLGQVWLGRDELAGREVVIKEPRTDRPGDAARAALAREAFVLGRLQHPNVVPLYDLVRGIDGRPAFYVMPLLGGDGLNDLADRFHAARPPGPATRLALLPLLTPFLDVCAALDHAHSQGVWHLDIKGTNVKLGPAGAAVVLDWGLARLADPGAGESLAATGAAGGTPAFMAPEQAESPASRLGPHTDVYGLGALLYLLLTGRPPHPDAPVHDRAELAAALRCAAPPPRTVWRAVPPALEAVCLKALAAEPSERYATVAALRADVQRWMADEPVSAYREPLPEQLTRWGRRHKRAATGAAAVLVTAVLALAFGLIVVNSERRKTDRQRQVAEEAMTLERESFRQALKAGDDYFTAVSDSPLLRAPGQQPLRRELLERGLAYYQDFLARRGDQPALRAEVAAAWFRVGNTQEEIGTLAEAVAALERAIVLGDELLTVEPTSTDVRAQLVRSYTRSAWCLRLTGRYADASSRIDRAAALAGGLPEEHPQRPFLTATVLTVRADILTQTGGEAAACRAAEQAEGWYARSQQDPRTREARGRNLMFLGFALRERRRQAEATDAFRKARGVFEALLDQPGWALAARQRTGACDNALGLTAAESGDHGRAVAYFEAARAARWQLVQQNPTVHTYRAELATTCLNLALELREYGDPRRAAELSREACHQTEALVRGNSTSFHFRSTAIRACRYAAGDVEAGRDWIAAARLRNRSAELLAGFGATIDTAAWRTLAHDALTDGLRQVRFGHWLAAMESFRQAFVCWGRSSRPDQAADQRARASRQ
jgi:serine/threonine-protein kinase